MFKEKVPKREISHEEKHEAKHEAMKTYLHQKGNRKRYEKRNGIRK
jgi:hypothetical protein